MAELIAFNKNEKLEYEGFCKLTINACSNLLLIEPKNEDYKMISSLFTWKYIAEKNILYVFGEHFFHDFALIFSNENKCKKVFNILIEKKANIGTSELIHKRFLPKLFEVISIRTDPKLKKILANWINKCENGEKEKHIQLLKNYEIYDLVFPKQRSNNRNVKVESDIEEIPVNLDTLSENNLDGEYFNEENNRRTLRKRSAPINYNNESDAEERDEFTDNNEYDETNAERPKSKTSKSIQTFNSPLKKIINESNFELISYNDNGIPKSHLFIFPTEEKKFGFEYYLNTGRQIYVCYGCQYRGKYTTARIGKNIHGKKIVKLNSTEHICEKREFKREKYIKKIVELSNVKFGKCINHGKTRTRLIIFPNENDKTKCYEYFWNSGNKLYNCSGCYKKNADISARHVKTSKKEYIELLSNEHICKMRKYIPEKYNFDPIKQIINSPNYEIFNYQRLGKSRKTVVVFLNDDKKMCHEYFFCKQSNSYSCQGCKEIGQSIRAVLQKNENGKECFKINRAEHQCHPRKYNPEKFTGDIIVKKPMYKIMEEKVMGKSQTKLLVFTSKDQKFCYKFNIKEPGVFYCIKCRKMKQYLRASLLKDEEENEFIAVRNKKHLCEPIEYLQTDFEEKKIVKLPNYKIIEKRNGKRLVKNLIIFDEDDKNLYYEYNWTIRRNKTGFFRCFRCKPFKINVQANLLYNEEYGGEYIELGKNLHKCKPKQYIPEELSPKIIYLPNFEERTVLNSGGLEKKILIIFDSNDTNLCYFYYFYKSIGHFICNGCNNLKQHVSAKLFTNESGEKYVQLSTFNQHICQPKKYEPQGFAAKIINAPYFELKSYLNRIKEKKTKLIVYSKEDKTLFYEYRFDTSAKKYLCVKCKEMKKHTFAKLKKNENGQDSVVLGPRTHFCKPLKISR